MTKKVGTDFLGHTDRDTGLCGLHIPQLGGVRSISSCPSLPQLTFYFGMDLT